MISNAVSRHWRLVFMLVCSTECFAGELLFFDDFDQAELDRDRWRVEGPAFWVNNEQQIYIDSEETITLLPAGTVHGAQNGVLAMRPRFIAGFSADEGRVADFVSGRIDTRGKFDFTHGRAEARIRLPDGSGLWPAFWLLGNDAWPGTGEIDILEYVGDTAWVSSALHGPGYSGDTPLLERYAFPPGEDATGWHVYAVQWDTCRIQFEVDGTPYYTVTRAEVEAHGDWRFDNPKHIILNFAVGGTYPWTVNGAETPYFGLPAETAEKIKAEDVAMLVDWVRVTAPR